MKYHQIRGSRTPKELMRDNTLVKHYAGSLAYGTSLPTSDTDIRGIFAGDPINILTPWFSIKETSIDGEEDTKFYEMTHFMKLCLDCNPNVIESLWVDDEDILFRTPAYDKLRENRHKLLSSKIAFTTSGYAIAQLKRIKGHNKWINNPQSKLPPVQAEFISLVQWFGDEKIMPATFWFKFVQLNQNHRLVPYGKDIYGIYPQSGYSLFNDDHMLNTVYEGNREELDIPLAIVKFNKKEYHQTLDIWKNYWEWKNNRNEDRSELEEKYGYDTKHGMHLVRLLRMGLEALRDGEILIKRPDAEELLTIRNGAWTYDEMISYADEMDNEIREVWYKKTELPKKPDIKFAANLLMEVQDMVWEK